ncbi:MAG: sulfate reduction electron transfer complex DsrMKJOP subunit DsrO [Acidiferrobacterales bacterium]
MGETAKHVSRKHKKRNGGLSRRNFMKQLGAGTATAAVGASLPASAQAAVSKRKVQYGMLIDTRRCIGCHACSVACKAEFDVPLGSTRSWVEYIEKGNYPNVSRNFLPRLCNHCSHPNCVDVCPTGATWKREEDGIVVVDPNICIGCKYCIQACPYDSRFLNPVTGAADKCDFCLHRVSRGLAPACVETCIGRARIFGDLNDPESEIARMIASNPVSVLRPGMGTEPNVYYIAADHTDEHEARRERQYIRVTTHRKASERR